MWEEVFPCFTWFHLDLFGLSVSTCFYVFLPVFTGNKDELKCGSEGSSGAGAKSLKEAITQLEGCDAELKTKCNTSSYSIPPNSDEVTHKVS